MRFNKKFQYGLLLSLYLLRSGRTSLSNVSHNLNIPLNFLEQVANKLRKAEIIVSHKGPGGGYSINSDTAAVLTPYDILKALGMTRSIIKDSVRNQLKSGKSEERAISTLLDDVSNALFTVFNANTLTNIYNDLVKNEITKLNSVTDTMPL